jgi:hypothetical protein
VIAAAGIGVGEEIEQLAERALPEHGMGIG